MLFPVNKLSTKWHDLPSALPAPLSGSSVSCIQVILCFSPVGSVLRVRARKFPAVVNCTAIDWFHEWPEEALVSVSARFLQETEGVQVRRWARLPLPPSVPALTGPEASATSWGGIPGHLPPGPGLG